MIYEKIKRNFKVNGKWLKNVDQALGVKLNKVKNHIKVIDRSIVKNEKPTFNNNENISKEDAEGFEGYQELLQELEQNINNDENNNVVNDDVVNDDVE